MNGSRKECMGSMWEKRKVLTGIELGSGLLKENWKDVLRPWYAAPRNKLWEQIIRIFTLIPSWAECAGVREKRWPMWRVGAVSWRKNNIKEGMITWHGILPGNFVVKVNWKENWYEQKPEGVVESEDFKKLWDFTVQCDRKIEARRPDVVFVNKKEREVGIMDVAIRGDDRVKDKELEKLEKYQLLKDEIAKVWRMRKVTVVPVVTGALGAVSDSFREYMKRIDVNVRL